jgi:DNA-binding PadR family transcriptional regulator
VPIHHAVLGLLADGPSYGYELKARFEEAIGPQWGELNIGHLYQILDRLLRDGFVSRRAVPQADRPARLVYRLTKAGRRELGAWLDQPHVRQGGYRDDFFLKLFVASRLGPDRLLTVLAEQRRTYLMELAALGELRKRHKDDPLITLLIDAAVLHTEANLKLVDRAEDRSARLTATMERGTNGMEESNRTEAG